MSPRPHQLGSTARRHCPIPVMPRKAGCEIGPLMTGACAGGESGAGIRLAPVVEVALAERAGIVGNDEPLCSKTVSCELLFADPMRPRSV
jgi:hypothetical protein